MNVPLLDLTRQYRSLQTELDDAVRRVVESQQFVLGEEVEIFEQKAAQYLGSQYALGVSSGTDALLLAMMALGIGSGDEVIVPTFSFFATAGVVSRLGATPVFVDIDPATYNIDSDQTARAITEKTRAIVPVHLFGQVLDCAPITSVAEEHGIAVVEDAAQAFGAVRSEGAAGTDGTIGCFSFFPSKNLGAFGDAGLVVTDDANLNERMRMMRVHGGRKDYIHEMIGGNFRIDALQAAVLAVKLPHLDAWSERRRENAAAYAGLFRSAGLSASDPTSGPGGQYPVALPIESAPDGGVRDVPGNPASARNHIYNQFVVRVANRDRLLEHLRAAGVGCAIYYPVPFHSQACFRELPSARNDFPVADGASEEVLALPIFPELTYDEQEQVVQTIADFYD